MAYQSVNPNDGKLFKSYIEMTDKELDSAIATAALCFETWQNKSFKDRAAIVTRAASLMRNHCNDFAKPVTQEMGKIFVQPQGEVTFLARPRC